MALQTDWLANYFENGIDTRRRRVFLHGDVDEDTIAHAAQAVILLDDESDQEITLYLSSLGGCMYEMFGMHDVIRACRCHVTGIAYGKIMSAAPLILRACDDALAHPSTQFMSHEESWGGEHKGHSHIRVDFAHYEAMEKLWATLMAERTRLNKSQWARKGANGRDLFFDARQALEWGVIDGIIQPDKSVRRLEP